MQHRIQLVKKSLRMLNGVWSENKTKTTIYRTEVEPILTYRCECWQFPERHRGHVITPELDYLGRVCREFRMEHVRYEQLRQCTNSVYRI